MPAYVVALIQMVTDPETYKQYVGQVQATLAPYGGRFLARKPEPALLEGPHAPARAVILEFPDEASARAWHASPAYKPVMELRQRASRGMLILLPGYADAGAPPVPMGGVHYLELVTPRAAETAAMMAEAYGWTFSAPIDELGGARVAMLPNGGRCGVRAPMHAQERPATRPYVRVKDLDLAVQRATEAGAQLALDRMDMGPLGRIAIWFHDGLEHAAWETRPPMA